MISPLLHTVARIVLPPALLVAAHLLLRGHHLPGGGFVAGLMTAAAVVLQYVAADRREAAHALPVRPVALIGLGLLVALVDGAGALVLGHPFLTSAVGHVDVPFVGHVETSTAVVFDLGVYLVVTGVTLAVLLAIED